MKQCTKCKQELPFDNFYIVNGRTLAHCKECYNAVAKVYRSKNREKQRAYRRDWSKRTCPKTGLTNSKKSTLKHSYGLSPKQYLDLLNTAAHKCEICGSKKSLCVDHNHKTGANRGILCSGCNAALGGFGDSVVLLAKAISYVNSRGTYATKRK